MLSATKLEISSNNLDSSRNKTNLKNTNITALVSAFAQSDGATTETMPQKQLECQVQMISFYTNSIATYILQMFGIVEVQYVATM